MVDGGTGPPTNFSRQEVQRPRPPHAAGPLPAGTGQLDDRRLAHSEAAARREVRQSLAVDAERDEEVTHRQRDGLH